MIKMPYMGYKISFLVFFISIAVLSHGCDEALENTYQGYIEGDFVYVSPSIPGKILKLHVKKGQKVEKGGVLFKLDPEPEEASLREAKRRLLSAKAKLEDLKKGWRPTEIDALKAELKRSEAALSLSKKELERARRLYAEQVIELERLEVAETVYRTDKANVEGLKARLKTATLGAREDQIEAAREEVEAASAAVDKARWRFSQTAANAPSTARVVDTVYYEGEWVQAGAPVVTLLSPEKVKARFFVPETKLGSIKTGQKVSVAVDGRAKKITGEITYIAPYAEYTPPVIYSRENRKKLVFMVEASFKPEDTAGLHPGQPVEVTLIF